ncbi:MAG: hypothetical protein GY949_05540 [Gammaproteobacteria bacterium]|nr:hypothetical protein [Gammaproteobacteria bacterium]
MQNGRGFMFGMLLGIVLSLVTGLIMVYPLMVLDIVTVSIIETPDLQAASEWLQRNLGLSVLPFGITLALYIHSLHSLAQRLTENAPHNEIAQLEHLTDVWTSVFFGIGVIWTAIGMRSALLYAIGDPAAAAQSGAFTILVRLVDGGILTALTTTIVGGIGGYLMRVIKSSCLGTKLNRYYENLEQRHTERVEDLLVDIKTSLVGHSAARAAMIYEPTEDS